MSTFLADVSPNLEYDTSGAQPGVATTITQEYHLPHTKTIDLIGEEFVPRSVGKNAPNVVVVSAVPISGNFTATTSTSQLIQATMPQVLAGNLNLASAANDQSGLVETSQHLNLSTVTVDMPSIAAGNATDENGGVLLCNLDELSRYIPENFYTDFNLSDTTSLEATTVSVPSSMTVPTMVTSNSTVHASQATTKLQSAAPIATILQTSNHSPTVSLSSPPIATSGPITIQLPTQPQPVQTMKTVTYVQGGSKQMLQPQVVTSVNSSFQPVKLTTTGFALTSTGERIAIKGLSGDTSTFQLQMKPAPAHTVQASHHQPQTIQLQSLQGLSIDPSKLTVLQELPEVGKVVIQEASRQQPDSITTILEEMKTEEANHAGLAASGIEYATAIPVSVTNLKDPQKGLKRLGPPSTIVLPAAKKGSRNIIFAGNTLPQGAIPVQINGLSTLNALPISAVKSIPLPINLSSLTPTSSPVLTTGNLQQVVSAKKTKVEVTNAVAKAQVSSTITTNKVNNNSLKTSGSGLSKASHQQSLAGKTLGNNKTCTWQFENGEICGKTFSKSYNLVVHMRMHEDVRPFQCQLCDQTFRQKAHLQRHETTHGIGTKVSRSASSSSPKRRRKRSSRGSTSAVTSPVQSLVQVGSPQISAQLQERLARVSEQFGSKKMKEDNEEIAISEATAVSVEPEEEAALYVPADGTIKSYGQKRKYSETDDDDSMKPIVHQTAEGVTTEIIELKDGEAFLAAATGSQDTGMVTRGGNKLRPIKVARTDEKGLIVGTDVILQHTDSSNDKSNDLMENSGASTTTVSLEAAVNEAVEGSDLSSSNDGTKVSHEPQKDILHAILIGENHPNHPHNNTNNVANVTASQAKADHNGSDDSNSNGNVHVEEQPKEVDFPPVSVQEFSSQNSN